MLKSAKYMPGAWNLDIKITVEHKYSKMLCPNLIELKYTLLFIQTVVLSFDFQLSKNEFQRFISCNFCSYLKKGCRFHDSDDSSEF